MLLVILLLACCCSYAQTANPASDAIHPGTLWLDTDGHPINAHGGGVIFFEGKYYWYGEHKLAGKSEAQSADGGIHVYSSADLVHWKDEGLALSVENQDAKSDITLGCILERPKVLYNAQDKLFHAYFKFYPKGTGYLRGYVGMATSKTPTGPFQYQGKRLAASPEFGTGDFALTSGEDGRTYHLSVRKPDKVFVLGLLAKDGNIGPPDTYQEAEGVESHTEAPAVVLHGGQFYLLGSGSTGFAPNPARSFVASSIRGPYKSLGNFVSGTNSHNGLGSEVTFGAQISFVLPVHGKKDAYIAMFDLWQPKTPIEGKYIWLPLTFENGKPVVHWIDEWSPASYFKIP
jgi:hypothetical protein